MYAVNGTSDNVNAIDLQMLTSDCTVTWYYVDDYTKDGVPDLNNINADHVCRINDWKTTSKATVFARRNSREHAPYAARQLQETMEPNLQQRSN